jgi:hypothetical protein
MVNSKEAAKAWKADLRRKEKEGGQEAVLERAQYKYFQHNYSNFSSFVFPETKTPSWTYSHIMTMVQFNVQMGVVFYILRQMSSQVSLPQTQLDAAAQALAVMFKLSGTIMLGNFKHVPDAMTELSANEDALRFLTLPNEEIQSIVAFTEANRDRLREALIPSLAGGSKKKSTVFDELFQQIRGLRGGGDNCKGLKMQECEENDHCQYVAGRRSQNLKKKQYYNEDGKLMTNDGLPFCMSKYEPEIDRKTGFTTAMVLAAVLGIVMLGFWSQGSPTTTEYSWFGLVSSTTNTTASGRIAEAFRWFDGLYLMPGYTSALVQTGQRYAAADAAVAGAMTAAGTLWFVGITHPWALATAAVTKGLLRFGATKTILELQSLPKTMEVYGSFYISVLKLAYLLTRDVVQKYHVQKHSTRRPPPPQSIDTVTKVMFMNYVEASSELGTKAVQGITDAMKEASWLQGVVLLVLGGFGWPYIASILNTVRGITNSYTTGTPVSASIMNQARDADLARRRGQQGRLPPIRVEEDMPPGQRCECILQSGPSKNQRCPNAAKRKINDRWVCGRHLTCTSFVAREENAEEASSEAEASEESASSEEESSSEESSSSEEESEDGDDSK